MAPSDTDTPISDFLCSSGAFGMLLSALGGIIVPILENFFNQKVKQYLSLGLSFFFAPLPSTIPQLGRLIINSPTSLFGFFGLWHVLLFFPPTAHYMSVLGTDTELLESLTIVEYCIRSTLGHSWRLG